MPKNKGNIIDQKKTAAAAFQFPEQLAAHPPLCQTLDKYNDRIFALITTTVTQGVSRNKLRKIQFSTFHNIDLYLAGQLETLLHMQLAEAFLLLTLWHTEAFNAHGPKMVKFTKLNVKEYCRDYEKCTSHFAALFLEGMERKEPVLASTATTTLPEVENYLHWAGSEWQQVMLQNKIQELGWVVGPCRLDRLLDNMSGKYGLIIYHKRLRHIAFILRLLKDAGLVEAHEGKGYMELAAQHIIHKGKPVTTQTLNTLSSQVYNDPQKYPAIVSICINIANEILKVEKQGPLVVSKEKGRLMVTLPEGFEFTPKNN